ncbi:MAG: hypothetical protein C4338_00800 [Rhodanobacteraceae bacterium]
MSAASLVWAMLFSAVGVGFFIYGKRQSMSVPLLCGLGLMVYPWFVASAVWLVVIGLTLMAIPWFVRY